MWEKGQDRKAERQQQEEQSFGFGEEAKEERGEFGNIAGSPDGAARERRFGTSAESAGEHEKTV